MKNKLWVLVLIAGAIAIYYFTKGGDITPPPNEGEGNDSIAKVDTIDVVTPEPDTDTDTQ